MAAPTDSLEGKVEYSVLAELSDGGLEDYANLYCGHEFEEVEGSQVLVTCFGGPPVGYNCGPKRMRVRVAVRSRADRDRAKETTEADPREVHREIVQAVRDTLEVDGIAATLSGHEEDFTCFFFTRQDVNTSVDGRYFVTDLEFEANCIRADVS